LLVVCYLVYFWGGSKKNFGSSWAKLNNNVERPVRASRSEQKNSSFTTGSQRDITLNVQFELSRCSTNDSSSASTTQTSTSVEESFLFNFAPQDTASRTTRNHQDKKSRSTYTPMTKAERAQKLEILQAELEKLESENAEAMY
jgi:hypothetical protein